MIADHALRSAEADAPLLHRFMAMDMDHGEAFDLIIEDLIRLPRTPGVIVEGFRLLPRLVTPLLSVPAHAVWLLPTPDFRQAVVESRGWPASGFLAQTTDPARALRNLLQRDRLFTDLLREEAARLEVATVDVDVTMSEDNLTRRVTEVFGL